MAVKQQLVAAVEGRQPAPFLSLIQRHEKKHKTVDLEEVVLGLSGGEVEHVWGCLHTWADEQVTAFVREEEQAGGGGESAASGPANTDKEGGQQYSEAVLHGIVKVTHLYITTLKDGAGFVPEKMLEMTVLLHEMVGVLRGGVVGAIVALCELWWLQGLQTHQLLILHPLTHLLQTATRKGAQRKDVVRLWKLYNGLNTIDLSSTDNTEFAQLLVSCVSAPVFLSCDEGVKWLAGLFSFPPLIAGLHKAVRLAISECTRAHSAKYGEVYFKAWKASQGRTKKTLEEDCLQDLMYTAIHVNPMSSHPSANLHHLLHHLHSHKKHRVFGTLLTELYQPILWRSFNIANGYVRMNAVGLLCDAFPLSDHNMNLEENDNLLEKQYHTLKTVLLDPCHLVRITAVKGVFKILSKYWLVVPNAVIKEIFKTLLTVLVYDVTTGEVRLEVVKGLTLLLGSPDAVPFLSQVLPRLGDVFDDANAAVREAFAKLLLKVKGCQSLKYWDIVPMHHLLHRLELDNSKVARQITGLLLSTLHPATVTDEELLQRSLSLLAENRMAARKFYMHAGSMIGLPNVVHFIKLLWLCLANHITLHRQQQQQQQQQQQSDEEENESSEEGSAGRRGRHSPRGSPRCERDSLVSTSNKENAGRACGTVSNKGPSARKDRDTSKVLAGDEEGGDEEKEEESGDEEVSPLDSVEVVCGMLDTVGILWTTNAHRLARPQNTKYLETLRTKISKNYQQFFRYFKGNADASCTLLYIASFLPKSLVPTLVGHCMSQLKTLQSDQVAAGSDTSYKNFVTALCNWNRADSLLELLSEWLEEGFRSGLSGHHKEKRRSRRQVRFCETVQPKPLVALHILRHVLEHPLNRVSVLQRQRAQVLDIIQDTAKVKDVIEERLQSNEELSSLCCDQFVCECWSLYLRLVVVCRSPSRESSGTQGEDAAELHFDSPAYISECLEWASSTLVPYLGEKSGGKRKLEDRDEAVSLAATLLGSLTTSSTHLLIIGAVKVPFVYRLNDFAKMLLETDTSGRFWDESLFLAHEGYEFLWVYESDQEAQGDVTPVQLANLCISSMADYFQRHNNPPQECGLSSTLVQFLMCLGQRCREDQGRVLGHLVACVVDHLCWRMHKDGGVNPEVRRVAELGGLVGLLVGALQKQSKLCIAVMEALTHYLATTTHELPRLLAVCHLLKVLLQDSGKISRYSLKQTVVAADSAVAAAAAAAAAAAVPGRETEDTEEDTGTEAAQGDAAKTVMELLDDLKESLGIV